MFQFSNPADVIKPNKLMLVPLDLSLYNTSPVKILPIIYIIKPDILSKHGIKIMLSGLLMIMKSTSSTLLTVSS